MYSPECGNGFLEPGEECDCGLPKFCENSCCNASTCKLHPHASCAAGECCEVSTCSIRSAGTMCRPADGDCDIPEYCTGNSENCPVNSYKRDTEECGEGKAYCFEGACRSHDDQCKFLWDDHVESVPQCYGNNVEGTNYGNCGKNWIPDSFKQCARADIMCGQLQCSQTHQTSKRLEDSFRVTVMHVSSPKYPYYDCQAATIDVGLFNADPALVPNGAKCGDQKMCIRQKCLSIESLRASGIGVDCPENCNGHGICDNTGNCHCETGYAPPLCSLGSTGSANNGKF